MNKKAPSEGTYSGFAIGVVLGCFVSLLSNTKLTENIIQLVLVGDLAGYFAQILQAPADIQCQQIAGNPVF